MNLPIPIEQLKERLIADGIISSEKFDAYVAEAERKNQNLLELLISENVASTLYLYGIISELLGVGLASLGLRHIDENVLNLLPEEVARQQESIVFGVEEDGTLDVAMLDPNDLQVVEFLTQYLKARIRPYLATREDLNRGYAIYGFKSTSDFQKIIEENVQESLRKQSNSTEEAAADLPIVAIVENILSFAISLRASDIHIETLEEATLIRYRIDGILREIIRIPKSVHSAIAARFKILSGLKIDEHYKPQDGRFRHNVVNQTVDVRVSVMPTFYGEKVEMRLLESAQKPLSLEEIGILPRIARVVEDNMRKTYGMLIICGPTGSGKSTTLYAFMNILNRPNVNICTIEDPIEYNMRYINQSQINVQAGITFASGLRALLRQDPNIIMVGEIRDKETAAISVQAALTGHLLLSSLHTNDAPTAIPRLFDLDIPPYLVGSVLNLVVAQRLVRRICNSCIYSYEESPENKEIILRQLREMDLSDPEKFLLKMFFKGKGCAICAESGYRGRIGIFEILAVSDTIKKMIVEPHLDLDKLRAEARQEGSRTMFEDGLEKIQLGITTVEEVLRVIRE
ncbi:MAG: GspE/PulE family protein [Candidatus Liptonbacteria bacterium]